MFKTIRAGFVMIFLVSLSSAFWMDYYARVGDRNRELREKIEKQYQEKYDLRQEINHASKERQRLITEIINLKRRLP